MNALMRATARRLLRSCCRIGRIHGYCYQAVETYGQRLGSHQPLSATLPNGMTMLCDVRDHVQRHIYYMGAYEPIESHLFCRLIQPGWTVFDVGANIGQYSLLAAPLIGPTGVVHAFEPVPKNSERFQNHLTLNQIKNVVFNQVATWHERGELELGLAADMVDNAGSYSAGAVTHSQVPIVKVQTIPLDDYVAQNNIARVDLLKMDIEGSEYKTLQGIMQTLRRDRPIILMEVNRGACISMGYEPMQLWELLVTQLGYRAWQIGHSASEWVEFPDFSQVVQANALLTPGELPAALTEVWNYHHCLAWARSAGGGSRYLPQPKPVR